MSDDTLREPSQDELRKQLDEILNRFAEWTINNVNHGIYIPLPSPETKNAIRELIADRERQARQSRNQRLINELELIETMTHEGRGTIAWEMDSIATYIKGRLATLTNPNHQNGDK